MNQLEAIKKFTKIAADSGDTETIKRYRPTDATTNPSLIARASEMRDYQPLVEEAIRWGKNRRGGDLLKATMRKISVDFGVEILKIIPGRVSTEIDPRLAFDIAGSTEEAYQLIALYEEAGIDRERILIKIPATWEGIQVAKALEKEGIQCNMTLIFSSTQAIACGEVGVTMVSPFVGRILDWHQKSPHATPLQGGDPGVHFVTEVFRHYKRHNYGTEIMAASFRNKGEILALTGCDLLTISPAFLEELRMARGEVEPKLHGQPEERIADLPPPIEERAFRWNLNEDAMATEKLAEGIRLFARDTDKLARMIQRLMEHFP